MYYITWVFAVPLLFLLLKDKMFAVERAMNWIHLKTQACFDASKSGKKDFFLLAAASHTRFPYCTFQTTLKILNGNKITPIIFVLLLDTVQLIEPPDDNYFPFQNSETNPTVEEHPVL